MANAFDLKSHEFPTKPKLFGTDFGTQTAESTTPFPSEVSPIQKLPTEIITGEESKRLAEKIFPEETAFLKTPAGRRTEDIINTGLGIGLAAPEEKFIETGRTALTKLISAIKEAKPARRVLEKEMTAERARRAFLAERAGERVGGGEPGFIAQLKTLKGPLAERPTFEPIRKELQQEDINNLFNMIDGHAPLTIFEKIHVKSGLDSLLRGEIPQPSQLSVMEDIYGQDLIKSILDKRGVGRKAFEFAKDLLFNTQRAFITAFDSSAVLRQAVVMTADHPVFALRNVQRSFREAFSPELYKAWFTDIQKEPLYKLYKDSGGYLSNAEKLSERTSREEVFSRNLAEKIPIVGPLIKASERIYSSYLNKMRYDVFKKVSAKFMKEGLNPKVDKKAFKDLAKMVNVFTGRGDLGSLGRISDTLSNVFFAPRLVASRIQALNPVWYARQHPAVRKEAIKSFAEYVGTITTICGLSNLGGAKCEIDPRSGDFMKVKVGNTRWDLTGGFGQMIRIFSQMMTGQRKNLSTGEIINLTRKRFPFETRADVALRFARYKLAPTPGMLGDLLYGQNVVGQDVFTPQYIQNQLIPLYIQDIVGAYNDFGSDTFWDVGIPSFFGVGIQTFKPREKRRENPFNL